jgi:hypothetical protein
MPNYDIKTSLRLSQGIAFGIALALGISAIAFSEPSNTPPVCPSGTPGCDAPLNVSGTAQTKAGDLTVNKIYATNISVAPGISEYNVTNVNGVIGYNDLFLRGNSWETAPVYIAGSDIHFYTNGTEKLTILNNGNVGIGTTNPGAKLDVNGTIRTGFGAEAGQLFIRRAPGQGVPLMQWEGETGNVLGLITVTGDVGIGTTNPGERLDVAGRVKGTELCIGGDCRSAWPAGAGSTPDLQAVLTAGNNPTSHIESQGQINTTSYIHAGYNNIQGDTGYYTRMGEIYGWRGLYTGARGMMLRTESSYPIRFDIGGFMAQYENAGNFIVYNPEGTGGQTRLGAAWGKKGIFTDSTLYLNSQGAVVINDDNQENWVFDGPILTGRAKQVLDVNDSYLRLNQGGNFSSGVYTSGRFRADGDIFQGGESDGNRMCRKDGTNCLPWTFGGMYVQRKNGFCVGANPLTGGCTCPSGFTAADYYRDTYTCDTFGVGGCEHNYFCYR